MCRLVVVVFVCLFVFFLKPIELIFDVTLPERMDSVTKDWNGWQLCFLKTYYPKCFPNFICVVCNVWYNAWETYLFDTMQSSSFSRFSSFRANTSLRSRSLEVMGPRKNGAREGDTRGERERLPERPMKIVFTRFLRVRTVRIVPISDNNI